MTTETLIWLIPLPPVLAFFLIVLFTHRNKALSHTIGVGAALLSFFGSMLVFFKAIQVEHLGEHPFEDSISWLPTGDTWLEVGVLIDPLSAIVLFFVAWTVLMIFLYSVGYHNFGQPKGDHDQKGLPPHGATLTDKHGHSHVVPSIEPMYSRFFAFIGLFAFGMYTLVVSNNLLTLFVGWEIMGLCSYLLIGFWFSKPSARDAAVKAFMTTRIGDVFMLLGIVYLYTLTGTLSYRDIFYNEEVLHMLAEHGSYIPGFSAAALIGCLLFIGTIGKSAQFPLHVWFPDAMEGPTPVSAMIHAATMVSAGVYMVIRSFPLMSAGWGHEGGLTIPMTFMLVVGSFTAIFAATIAVAQNDVKRVLAYSTISQLGFMIAALGMGAYVAAAFHLVTHAFFKALLFLGSGSIIHGMEHGVLHTGNHSVDPQDMYNMGGLRSKMPLTFWTFLIGGFALSGFPVVTAGFWSKDEILADAFAHHHYIVLGVLSLAAFLTAFYTMRQITLTFLGQPRTKEAEHASENKWMMTLPLVVLSFFAVTFGWLGIPVDFPILGPIVNNNWFHEFVGGTLLEHPEPVTFSWVPLIISLVVALGGLTLGWMVYKDIPAGQPDPLQKPLAGLYGVLQNRYYIDQLYSKTFVRFSLWFADLTVLVDRQVIDGVLHSIARIIAPIGTFLRGYPDRFVNWVCDVIGDGTHALGQNSRVMQTGKIQNYMLMTYALMVLVVVVGGGFFLLYDRILKSLIP